MVAFLDSQHVNELKKADQPLLVGTTIYFKVAVNSRTEKLELLLDRCYATPTSNRETPDKHQFIVGG